MREVTSPVIEEEGGGEYSTGDSADDVDELTETLTGGKVNPRSNYGGWR